ncbi:MAG: nitroreductase family protein [Thermoanaerobaculia bacterium]
MPQQEAVSSVVDVIFKRHSVRDYKPQKLDRATVSTLLASAVRAPTAIHEEPWAFVIVQDTSRLKRLSDRAKELLAAEAHHYTDRGGHTLDFFAAPDFNLFYNASTLIVICGKTAGPFVAADCWLAAENLMLTATSMGLGTCVIGSALLALNTPEWKAELGIPADFSAIAPIIAGLPSGEGSPTARKEPWILAWK